MKSSSYLLGIVYLAVSGCVYGIMAPLVRIANSALPPFSSVTLRYTLVSLILFLILWNRHELSQVVPRSRHDLLLLLTIGLLGAGFSNIAFSLAVLHTTIANATLLFSLYAVFTPLLSGLVLKEWPMPGQWIALLIAMVGTGFIFTPTTFGSILGNALAFGGALLVSVQYVGTRLVRRYNALIISLYLALGSVILALPLAIVTEWILHAPTSVTTPYTIYPAWAGWLALIAFAGANLIVNLLVSEGFRLVRSSIGGILLLLEPLVALMIGLLLFAEIPLSISILGATLILGSSVSSVILEKRRA